MKKFYRLFVPAPENNFRASVLKPASLAILIAVYLLNQSILKSIAIARPGILGYSSEITQQKVFDQTNQERLKNNLPALRLNSLLSASAKLKAEDMFVKNYWAHQSPDGQSPWFFIKSVDYRYSIAGENLAKDFYDTESMFKAWMASPTHKDNIIHPKYQEIGIAVVDGVLDGLKTTLVVQHFGTPLVAIVDKSLSDTSTSAPVATSLVLAESNRSAFRLNPTLISKTLGTAMFILILSVLVIDGFFTLKNKTKRLTGSSTGHIGFLIIILALMLFSRQGTIF